MKTEPFYTPKTLAKRLSISERTAADMLASRPGRPPEIPSYKIGGSRRIDPEDVDVYLKERRSGS